MKRFWIITARWGHLLFLAIWTYGARDIFSDASKLYLFSATTLVSLFILAFLKVLVHAPRPFLADHVKAPFWVPKHDSFPSGHAWMLATGTMLLLSYAGPTAAGIAVCSIGMLVSYARFRAGVHRPVEVLVGFVGGGVVTLLALGALGVPVL